MHHSCSRSLRPFLRHSLRLPLSLVLPLPVLFLFLLHLLHLPVTTNASCPNACSRHGVCRLHSRCTCYPEWSGYDCSIRDCPHHLSWNDPPFGRNQAHFYEACSGRGVCNYKTGECVCWPGYTGDGCRRMSCPNQCSGHGQCLTTAKHAKLDSVGDFFSDRGHKLDKGVIRGQYSYKAWDRDKTTSCLCDPGYIGISCKEMECPRGDDPLTTEDQHGQLEVSAVQTITVGPGTGTIRHLGSTSGYFTLSFTDPQGKRWTTRPILASDKTDTEHCTVGSSQYVCESGGLITANNLRMALTNLPNDVIDKVEVSLDTSSSIGVGLMQYRVTFVGAVVSGKQPLLECNHVGCDVDGCAPRFAGIQPAATAVCTVKGATFFRHETEGIAASAIDGQEGTAENEECSRRGLCDRKTGRCACFPGYQGAACNIQTVMI